MKFVKRLYRSRPIQAAFFFALTCHLLDIISTMLAMTIPGVVESNPSMRDPETWKFILRDGIAIKLAAMVVAGIPTIFLFWGEQNNKPHWSPLPYYIIAFPSLMAALSNMVIFWKG